MMRRSRFGTACSLILAITLATSGASALFFGAVPAERIEGFRFPAPGAALCLRHASTSTARRSVVSTREITHEVRTPCSTSRSSTTGTE